MRPFFCFILFENIYFSRKKIMAKINPYLTFKGNCEEAFNFYKNVFKSEFIYIGRFNEMPADEQHKVSEEDGNKIMHIAMPIGNDTLLMGSDTGGEWAAKTIIGNNISISISAESKEEADVLFAGLSNGGVVTMPLASTFWGDYFGMCIDPFEINWMISFDEKK